MTDQDLYDTFIELCGHRPLRLVRAAAKGIPNFATCVDKNGFSALHASLGGDTQVTLFLIQHSADVNYVRPGGYHPLFYDYKSIYRYRKNLLLFLAAGFDPNVINAQGDTLLHIFARRKVVSLCRLIFTFSKVPVRVDIPGANSETVADIITAWDIPELVRLLERNTKNDPPATDSADLPPNNPETPSE